MRAWLLLAVFHLPACDGWDGPDLERMIRQRRADAFETSDLFPDGVVMRRPPNGTIRRDALVGQPHITDGLVSGEPVAQIPIGLTRASLEHARGRFDVFCAVCHGVTGDGVSDVAQRMGLRRPPSLLEHHVRHMAAGRIYQVITSGYGLMPGYAQELSVHERWAVVGYLEALQLSRDVALAELPSRIRAEAEGVLR